jgi:glutaredoxin
MYHKEVTLYIRSGSLRCWRARRFLAHRGYDVKVIDATNDSARGLLMQLADDLHHKLVLPYVFVDNRPVGSFCDIKALDRSGALERLVRGEV